MNRTRRSRIATISLSLSGLATDLQSIAAKEEEAKDSMPENLQGSDRYTAAEEAVELLTEVADELQSAADRLDEITS